MLREYCSRAGVETGDSRGQMILMSWSEEVVVELRHLVEAGDLVKVEAAWLVVLDVGYDIQVFLLEDRGCHYGDAKG